MQMVRNIKKNPSDQIRSVILYVFFVFLAAALAGCNFFLTPNSHNGRQEEVASKAFAKEGALQESVKSRVVLPASQLSQVLSFRNLKVLLDPELAPKQLWLVEDPQVAQALDASIFFTDGKGGLYKYDLAGRVKLLTKRSGANFSISEDFRFLAITEPPSLVTVWHFDKFLQDSFQPADYKLDRLKVEVFNPTFQVKQEALLFSGSDGRVYRWRFKFEQGITENQVLEKGKALEMYVGSASLISSLVSHPSGRIFAAGDWSAKVFLWLGYDTDAFGGKYDTNIFGTSFFADDTARRSISSNYVAPLQSLAFDSTGQHLLLAGESGSLELFQVRGLKPIAAILAHKGLIRAVAGDSNFENFASCGRDAWFRTWRLIDSKNDIDKKELVLVSEELKPNCTSLAFTKNNLLLIAEAGKIESRSVVDLPYVPKPKPKLNVAAQPPI